MTMPTPSTPPSLIPPFGGRLVELSGSAEERAERRARAAALPSIQISARAACDLELLATGAFSPLDRFMGRADHERVLSEMRLADGTLFPMPITLPVDAAALHGVGEAVALRDATNRLLAVLRVEEVFPWDRAETARATAGTVDARHPLVAEMERWGDLNLTGRLELIDLPGHADFKELRLTPAEVRSRLAALGAALAARGEAGASRTAGSMGSAASAGSTGSPASAGSTGSAQEPATDDGRPRLNVVAFQTRNPLHRVHEELTRRAIAAVDGVLLLHPAVGLTKPGDVDHFTRVRSYLALMPYYAPDRALLSLLPVAMRMAGPREALWHALIRRNFGASHFIVGRDHAGPGKDSQGRPFYGPYDAQELVARHAAELGVTMVPFEELVYLPAEDRYEEASRVPSGVATANISGTQVRDEYLGKGRLLPDWFTRPEVARILGEAHPPRHKQGACVWFTGLSGAGKSTVADQLTVLLQERGRQVTVLDGDVVRTHLSKGLGFSKEDRDANIRRIGFVAAEVVRHGGVAICAAVSPYRAVRDDVRAMVGGDNQFVEVFVDTPLAVCEERDVKGLYAKARRGELKGFTGIDDPYEAPLQPELRLDTVAEGPEANARRVLGWLADAGLVAG